jgi:hypothetical protein
MRRSPLVALLLVLLSALAAAVAVARDDDAPTLAAPQASGITERTAELSAIADTGGVGGVLSVSYGRHALTELTTVTIARIPRGAKLARVGGVVMDLDAGTTYHYRLTLSTIDGTATTPDATFTTAGGAQAASCRVPVLRGRTWPVAHRALRRSGCRTGRVRRPAHVHHGTTLVVASQTIAAGRVRAAGTKVGVRLAVRR